MNQLIETAYTLSAVLGINPETGQRRLAPMVEIRMTLAPDGPRPPGFPPDLTTVAFRMDEDGIRELAAGLITAANELNRMVRPLCEVEPINLEQALQIAASVAGYQRQLQAATDPGERDDLADTINEGTADLASAGWQLDELKQRLEAEKPGHGSADVENCHCDKPDLGAPPPVNPQPGETFTVGHGPGAVVLTFRAADQIDPLEKFDVLIGETLQRTADSLMMTAFIHGWTLGVEARPDGLVVVGCVKNEDVETVKFGPTNPIAGDTITIGDGPDDDDRVELRFTDPDSTDPRGPFDVPIGWSTEATAGELIQVARVHGFVLNVEATKEGILVKGWARPTPPAGDPEGPVEF